jgi:lipoxygenase
VAIKDWSEKRNRNKGEHVVYSVEFMLDPAFGEPGAVTVLNRHQKEFFLESIVIEGHGVEWGPVHFACDSWIQSHKDLATKRIFFSNRVCWFSNHIYTSNISQVQSIKLIVEEFIWYLS